MLGIQLSVLNSGFFFNRLILLYIYLFAVLDLSCGTRSLRCSMWDLVPCQGLNPGPLHWELGVLATGPPGKSHSLFFKYSSQWLTLLAPPSSLATPSQSPLLIPPNLPDL